MVLYNSPYAVAVLVIGLTFGILFSLKWAVSRYISSRRVESKKATVSSLDPEERLLIAKGAARMRKVLSEFFIEIILFFAFMILLGYAMLSDSGL